jgi:hypothetical protein
MSGSPERVIKYAALATVLDQLTGAAATATTQATAAATSNTNSSHWAEGSDAQVIALGGEKSSKGWNTKTNQDGSHWAEGTDQQVIALGGTKSSKGWADVSETQADRSEAEADRSANESNKAIAFSQTNSYRLALDLAPFFNPSLVAEITATWDEATTSPSITIS